MIILFFGVILQSWPPSLEHYFKVYHMNLATNKNRVKKTCDHPLMIASGQRRKVTIKLMSEKSIHLFSWWLQTGNFNQGKARR